MTGGEKPFNRGLLFIRAKGIFAYALGIMVLIFGFMASTPLVLTANDS